jgi:AraC-like DNA-binding protein
VNSSAMPVALHQTHVPALLGTGEPVEIEAHYWLPCCRAEVAITTAGPGSHPDEPSKQLTLHMIIVGQDQMILDIGSGRRVVDVSPGLFTITPPMTFCDFFMEKTYSCLAIGLDPLAFRKTAMNEATEVDPVVQICEQSFHDPVLESIAWTIVHVLRSSAQLNKPAVLAGLISSVVEALASRLALPRDGSIARGRLTSTQLGRLTEYIRKHLPTRIRVEDLAQVIYLSPSRFTYLLKSTTGFSPYAFVRQERVNLALKKLASKNGHFSMADIAAEFGFCDQSHFCREIKTSTGRTPSEIRFGT